MSRGELQSEPHRNGRRRTPVSRSPDSPPRRGRVVQVDERFYICRTFQQLSSKSGHRRKRPRELTAPAQVRTDEASSRTTERDAPATWGHVRSEVDRNPCGTSGREGMNLPPGCSVFVGASGARRTRDRHPTSDMCTSGALPRRLTDRSAPKQRWITAGGQGGATAA